MPKPKEGENRDDYISRCVSYLADEDPSLSQKERLGKCFGMWKTYSKKGESE